MQETVWLNNIPIATVRGGQVHYVHADHLGTPRAITEPGSGTEVWRWESDPFGRAEANEDPDGNGQAFAYNLRFPGQYYDAETGKHYNYFRDYDPSTGRYIESDPIGLDGGLNRYSYSRNSPTKFNDPSGLSPACVCTVECSSVPLTAVVFCTKVMTCVDGCGEVSIEYGPSQWYSWGPVRPFYFVGSFKCDEFPGEVPGSGNRFGYRGV